MKLAELLNVAMKDKLVEFKTHTKDGNRLVKGLVEDFSINYYGDGAVECEIIIRKCNNSTATSRIGAIVPSSFKFFDHIERSLFKLEHDL